MYHRAAGGIGGIGCLSERNTDHQNMFRRICRDEFTASDGIASDE
jgi:hypothetical protein